MTAKTYGLDFDGYWREPNIGGLPTGSGIYGVYACEHVKSSGKVTLNRLIYIGESNNIKNRVANHEKRPEWRNQLSTDEEICINAALISPATDRERAEAAMIYRHKPVCNTEYVNNFPFNTTTINTSGKNALMDSHFVVRRT